VPEREEPGKIAAASWPRPTARTIAQVISVPSFFAAQKKFHDEKNNAAEQQRPRDRCELFRQFYFEVVNDESAGGGNPERDENFQQIILRFAFADFKNEFVEALREQRQHGDDGATLDDDVEEVALVRVEKFLGDEQMAGGRNG